MNYKIKNFKIITMGGGESKYVQAQEEFVRNNYNSYKKALPEYSQLQIQGKLRQLYARSDEISENKFSYINETTWKNAKKRAGISGKRVY